MSLKISASKNILWTAIDRISYQILAFILNIILARILSPRDFGLVSTIIIFITIAQIFIQSGLGIRILQYQNITNLDLSTIFIFNLAVSILMYFILYFTAPLIAQFFREPILIKLIRILSISLIIMALGVVQTNLFNRNFNYKYIFIANTSGLVLSYTIGIYLAYHDFKVWSIVIQNLCYYGISVGLLWVLSHWKPSFKFSIVSFKTHFPYGFKLLLTGVYATSLNNVSNVLIGRFYSITQLGYYTRSLQLVDAPNLSLTTILTQATTPLFSKFQNNYEGLIYVFRKFIGITCLIMFPMMLLISALSKPIIILLLTEKWISIVPLLKVLAIYRILYPLGAINIQLLNVIGRSDWFLYLDLSKLPLILGAILISFPYGIQSLILSLTLASFISYFMNILVTYKVFKYHFLQQLKDILPYLIIGIFMYLLVIFSISTIKSYLWQLIVGIGIGLFFFYGTCLVFLRKDMRYFFKSFKDVVFKK